MAKQDFSLTFKDATISLEDNEIVEYKKDEILTYTLSDVIARLQGEGRRFTISIKESTELTPDEE